MEEDMKQHPHTSTPAGYPHSPVVALGKARKLTRASFSGNRPEMINERYFALGG
jgi:hypothetical protein